MHFEVPKAKSFKEFGGEYLMIVISIITALALEHAVQTWHHRHLAHQAATRIDAEMQANVQELDKVLAHNKAEVKKLNILHDQLLAGLKAKEDSRALARRLTGDGKFGGLSIQVPALRREAWEVAIASQAASWMTQQQLERYSGIYANMRDIQTLAAGGGTVFLNGPEMLNVVGDINIGEGDAKAVYHIVRQMVSAYDSIDGNLQSLRDDLAKAADTSH
ncbi:hypothetical protein GTP58_16395 [Duganella sp. CY15W]|uniref:hypothetical protein n=1 Tax=Duganella sp. CY15W TaxID=2692172 RepID=UPI00136A0920|nr:hypothetical protein [Duganella sp. CY15W]MYM29913.1 hypothetical protein [Duganella sp. CY15W]